MSDESAPGPSAQEPSARTSGARGKAAPAGSASRATSSRAAKPAPKTAKPAEERPTAKPRPAASGAAKAAAAKSAAKKPATPRAPRTSTPRAASPRTSAPRAAAPRPAAPPAPPAEPTLAEPVEEGAEVAVLVIDAPEEVETEALETEALEAAPEVGRPEVTPEAAAAPEPIEDGVVAIAPPAAEPIPEREPVLRLEALTKRFGVHLAVDEVSLSLDPGTLTGIVGPNGAGKTTTLSMITGLLRPSSGRVLVAGIDVWRHPQKAKKQLGVLPDRLHTFDRLTGGQLLYYTGILHGLDRRTAKRRTDELADAFKVQHAMGRLVTDYSSGMLKKIALAAALIHAPRLLVLDEPFESVDPVSAMTVAQILRDFTAGGGTVLLSSHSMELVQRICDHVAVIVDGRLIAGGTVDEVRGDRSLQERFVDLAGADAESIADLAWLHRFSD